MLPLGSSYASVIGAREAAGSHPSIRLRARHAGETVTQAACCRLKGTDGFAPLS
jgi:hypothetical protein